MALPILADIQWSTLNGETLGVLTCGQLDREMYVAVNRGLEILGGKWNKKAGGHIFYEDPRPQLSAMLGTGTVTVERDGFFRTPQAVVLKMWKMLENKREPVLEPSAGDGAICDVLKVCGVTRIVAIEKNEYRRTVLQGKGYAVHTETNFLEYFYEFPTIVMNPPFEEGQDIVHITHAFENCLEVNGELVSVVSEGPFFRSDGRSFAFRKLVNTYGESVSLPDGAFKESGTMVKTRLVYLKKAR